MDAQVQISDACDASADVLILGAALRFVARKVAYERKFAAGCYGNEAILNTVPVTLNAACLGKPSQRQFLYQRQCCLHSLLGTCCDITRSQPRLSLIVPREWSHLVLYNWPP